MRRKCFQAIYHGWHLTSGHPWAVINEAITSSFFSIIKTFCLKPLFEMAEPISFTWGLHVMLSLFDRGRIRSRKVNLCFWRHWTNCFTLDVIRHYAVEVPRCFEHSQFFFRVINILNFAPQKNAFHFFLAMGKYSGVKWVFTRESIDRNYKWKENIEGRGTRMWEAMATGLEGAPISDLISCLAPLLSTAQLHTQMEEGMHRNISLKEVFRDRGYWMFNIGSPI